MSQKDPVFFHRLILEKGIVRNNDKIKALQGGRQSLVNRKNEKP